jgi:hypothetical protein
MNNSDLEQEISRQLSKDTTKLDLSRTGIEDNQLHTIKQHPKINQARQLILLEA